MATRILQSRRDRFIAAVIATLTPCSARMTVIFGLVAFYAGPGWAMGIYVFNILVIALSGKLLSSLMPEKTPGMILEVPAYHLPSLRIVLLKTWFRLREFIVVAWPLLIVGSIFLSLADFCGWNHCHELFPSSPYRIVRTSGFSGCDFDFRSFAERTHDADAFPGRRDHKRLSVMSLSQIMVFTLFVTFYIPCVATIAALVKEIGSKLMLLVVLYTVLSAILIGVLARLVFALIPIG